jgi:molybdate-binding protein
MGKLLFSKKDITNWISGEKEQAIFKQNLPDVLLGSHDPLLEWAVKQSKSGIAMSFDGSIDGLNRFRANQGMASGLHIYDNHLNEWNVSIVKKNLDKHHVVLMEWAKRDRGLIFKDDGRSKKSCINDFLGKRMVTRQNGSGSENYLKFFLKNKNLDFSDFTSTETAFTENDAVMLILTGQADLTLGLASEAEKYSLQFIPIVTERFDLVINRKSWFEKPFQKLINFCKTQEFSDMASKLRGYNIKNLGKIYFNS